jgi:hypothetical protein
MIKSKFISDILDLLFDGDDLGRKFRPQVKFLTEKDYNYTHMGLFVGFSHDNGIEEYRAINDRLILNGVIIRSKEIELGAEAILHFSNGLVDYLEIWSHSGEYPEKELGKYTMTQEWIGSPGRKIVAE